MSDRLYLNESATRVGVKVRKEYSCDGCKHFGFTSYAAQGDSGIHHWCKDPDLQLEARSTVIDGIEVINTDGTDTKIRCAALKARA